MLSRLFNGRLTAAFSRQNLLSVGRDVLIIFISITLSFLFDNWRNHNEERKQERFYLDMIRADLEEDMEKFKDDTTAYQLVAQSFWYFKEYAETPAPNADSLNECYNFLFLEFISKANTTGFETLKQTGKLNIISNKEVLVRAMRIYQEKIFALQQTVDMYQFHQRNAIIPYLLKNVRFDVRRRPVNLNEIAMRPDFQQLIRLAPMWSILQNYKETLVEMESLHLLVVKELEQRR
jgi:hypothetical protein